MTPHFKRILWASALLTSVCVAEADYASEVLADSPTAYWRLDETSGSTAADSSGNGNTGTYTGSPSLGATGALAFETPNLATDFDGSNDYVDLSFNLNPANTSLTIELWANAETISTTAGPVLIQQDGSNGRALLQVDKDSGEYATFLGGSQILSGVTAQTGQWTHIVLVFERTSGSSGSVQWYFDGQPQGSPVNINAESETGGWLIGRHKSTGNQFWDGRIDEVAIYESALSSARVQAHYNEASNTTPQPTASFYVDPANPSASDSNPGSESEPFETIGRGLQEAGANVTLFIAGGVYDEVLMLDAGGSAAQPFVIQAIDPGEVIIDSAAPVLLSSNTSGGDFLATDVHVRGLVLRNATSRTDKAALMPAAGWTIEKCRIEDSGGGILMDGGLGNVSNITIVDTVVEDCANYGIAGRGDRVANRPGPTNVVVRDSSVRRCHTAGNGQGSDAAGIYLSRASGATVEGCVVYDNAGPGIWLDYETSTFALRDNTIFAHHGREWWSGAGIQISLSGGPNIADSVIENNLIYSNTGPALALCESGDITISGNRMIDNGTCVSFRNIYFWNGSTNSFSIQSDNRLSDLSISGNEFKSWRREALTTWDGSLLSLDDLQNRNVAIGGNTYDPADPGDVFLSIRDDLPEDPLPGIYVLTSLADVQAQTDFGDGSTDTSIALPKGVELFESTTTGVASQVGPTGEDFDQANVLATANVGDTVVIPVQRLEPLAGTTPVGAAYDLFRHCSLTVEAVDLTAANALNNAVSVNALWAPVFLKARVADLSPYEARLFFDPSEGHGVRDNQIRVDALFGEASEDGPTEDTIRFFRDGVGASALTVSFSTGGSATAGTDYVDPGTSFALSSGTDLGSFALTPIPNDLVDGTREAVIDVDDGSGYFAATGSTASVFIEDKAFDTWRGTAFSYTGAAPADAGFNDDPDKDLKPNGIEFALRGDPLNPDGALVTVGESEAGHLTLTYDRPEELGDVVIAHELSPSLAAGSWSGDDVEIVDPVVDNGDFLTVTIQDKFPIDANSKRFLRVEASR